MATGPHQEQIERANRIGDAYVWSAIDYLDSPTEYREHLPRERGGRSMLLVALGLMVLGVIAGLAFLSGSLPLG